MLYRAFAGAGGLASFVRRRRLEEAHRLLMSHPARRISDIALEVGFWNFSHFSSAFKAAYGLKPSEVERGRIQALDAAVRMRRWAARVAGTGE
ncbi:helix-turn-helix domain-containing protein [Sphingomicrobium maritimum]|uniref:helix-turn-helix domain-containing protein n=1 Tax=Sphingomicrobium maritimum TaxID=3133972 RepID=UPI003D768E26